MVRVRGTFSFDDVLRWHKAGDITHGEVEDMVTELVWGPFGDIERNDPRVTMTPKIYQPITYKDFL